MNLFFVLIFTLFGIYGVKKDQISTK